MHVNAISDELVSWKIGHSCPAFVVTERVYMRVGVPLRQAPIGSLLQWPLYGQDSKNTV